jgi:hypothetical protein
MNVVIQIKKSQPTQGNIALYPLDQFTIWQNGVLKANPNMYRIRKWGDPLLGESVVDIGVSNFQAVSLYNTANNSMGGVSNYLRIPHSWVEYLRLLQVEDEYIDKQPDWRRQKMNWLCKIRGTIYFFYHGFKEGSWETLPYIEWGTIGLGGNLVNVESVEILKVKMPEGNTQTIPMGKIRCFQKSDQAKPLNQLLEEGLAHRCTCAYLKPVPDAYGDSPKGIVYSPVWSPKDFTFIGPGQPQPDAFYLPMKWLTK